MRMIGHVSNESQARTLSDFLYVEGIKNEVEPDKDGTWIIWVHSEDELDRGRLLLNRFLRSPGDPEILRKTREVRDLREVEEKEEARAAKRTFDRETIFRSYTAYPTGPLTLSLIVISVLVFIWQTTSDYKPDFLFISEPFRSTRDFAEVRRGEVWRLFTPIFLHSHILHILFNMLWLKDLGSMIETRLRSWYLLLLVLAIGAASNIGQYLLHGPAFGGMSGVVYGLLGYIWLRGKFDPASGLFLHPSVVVMMLIWFVICFTGILPIANTVHAVGLGMGVLWGYLDAWRSGRRV